MPDGYVLGLGQIDLALTCEETKALNLRAEAARELSAGNVFPGCSIGIVGDLTVHLLVYID